MNNNLINIHHDNITNILFIGDPHIMTSNIQEVELCIKKLQQLAYNTNPHLIVIGGDILHTHERLHTISLNKAYKLIDSMRKITKTFVLVGNHDKINNSQFLTDNHWMNGIKEWHNVVIVDTVIHFNINIHNFIFVPYVPPGFFHKALNTLQDFDWLNSTCIFAHQEFYGCKMGAITSIDGDKWSLDYPNIISGHIHSRQTPQKNIYYPGSMLQHAFGESNKNIIPSLTFNNSNNYILKEIDLHLPRKKIIYMNIDEIDDFVIPNDNSKPDIDNSKHDIDNSKHDIDNSKPDKINDKIKLSISGLYEEFKTFKKTKKYKKLIKQNIQVVFKPKKIEITNNNKKIESLENETTFTQILHKLILHENNEKLNTLYKTIIK